MEQLGKVLSQNDPDTAGINFLVDARSVVINMPTPLENVRLGDALDAIVLNASKPIKYSILDDEISFSMKDQAPSLFTRTFKVNTNMFFASLRKQTGLQTNSVSTMARKFFSTLGVDWESPEGKTIFYNDRLGSLTVRATLPDLDTIESAIVPLNKVGPQIHIKARFLEVPQKTFQDLVRPNLLTNDAVKSGTNTGPDLLTNEKFKAVLRALEQRDGVVALAEPEFTSTSGRQTQMRATQIINVVTNIVFEESYTNQDGVIVSNSIVPKTSTVETGPVLDVVPYVLSDGYTINLALIPSLTEFLGYDQPTNTTPVYTSAGEKINLPKALPNFRVRQAVANVNLWDGQTVVIGGLPVENYVNGVVVKRKTTASGKELVIFVTAIIVDPAGNRIHSDQGVRGSYDDLSKPRSTQF